jgi:hypothetical protein
MSMDADMKSPSGAETPKEDASEALPLEGDAESQAALALIALIDALPGCVSLSIEGLAAEGDVILVCVDAEGATKRVSVSAAALEEAVSTGIEPEEMDE